MRAMSETLNALGYITGLLAIAVLYAAICIPIMNGQDNALKRHRQTHGWQPSEDTPGGADFTSPPQQDRKIEKIERQ